MAIIYSGTTIGTFTLAQPRRELNEQTGDYENVYDIRGRQVFDEYKIQIRKANCLFCAIHVYEKTDPATSPKTWCDDIILFFLDEEHLKRCKAGTKSGEFFADLLGGELRYISLNLYYRGCSTMLKYFTRDGYNVNCYYKAPNKT